MEEILTETKFGGFGAFRFLLRFRLEIWPSAKINHHQNFLKVAKLKSKSTLLTKVSSDNQKFVWEIAFKNSKK